VYARSARSTRYHIAIAFAVTICLAALQPTAAQSARTAVVIPAVLASSVRMVGTAVDAPRCMAMSDSTIAVGTDSRTHHVAPESYWVEDSADVEDDVIDRDALSPGSGMVLVDPHGKIIASEKAKVDVADITPTDCCPDAATITAAQVARPASSNYTPSSGSPARERCVDAMNPPPNSRSPL